MIIIFILSSIPADDDRDMGNIVGREIVQNMLHIPMFGLLAVLWLKTFCNMNFNFRKAIAFSALITCSYSAFDEFHQAFIPGRFASGLDFLLNVTGLCMGLVVYGFIRKIAKKPLVG